MQLAELTPHTEVFTLQHRLVGCGWSKEFALTVGMCWGQQPALSELPLSSARRVPELQNLELSYCHALPVPRSSNRSLEDKFMYHTVDQNQSLDQRALSRNRFNAQKLIDSKYVEHRFCEKPVTTFSRDALVSGL